MRIGVGKKVGGVYVGASTSVKGKNIAKGFLYIIGFPFVFLYFIFVWPFVKLSKNSKKKKMTVPHTVNVNGRDFTMSVLEAQSSIDNLARVAEDSLKLVQETKNPEIYFKRWDTAIDTLEHLQAAYTICGTDNPAERTLDKLEQDKTKLLNDFIDRYAKEIRKKIYNLSSANGKKNAASAFKKIMLEYKDSFSNDSLFYLEKVSEEMMKMACEES